MDQTASGQRAQRPEGTAADRSSWALTDVDVDRPNAARMYDYYLGGFHNFAADRELAEQAMAAWPDVPTIARVNRVFLRRAVAHLVEQGVYQFLDIGSGVPTVGNVHEVAQALQPRSRVVYVDIEPVAVTHSRQILADTPHATAVQGDLQRPESILAHPEVTRLLDFSQPIGLLLVAVLPFVVDDDLPREVIGKFRQAFTGGSWLVVSHITNEFISPELTAKIEGLYRRSTSPIAWRGHQQVEALFDGYRLVDPGVVLAERWRADPTDDADQLQPCSVWAGVGRCP
jgi:hypothetical protein